MGDDVIILTAAIGDRPVAFALFVKDANEWHFFVAGFDYGRTQGSMTYFSLVFYVPIRLAIEKGVRRINYGIASYAPKLRRGCRLEPITLMVKCRSRWKQILFEPAARMARKRYARHE
jgi:predicted N-acyltransferase